METEQVDPSKISVGDRIVIWSTEANNDQSPHQFEIHQVDSVEAPNSTHPDSYDFEYAVVGADPKKFGAGVRYPSALPVTRIVSSESNELWMRRR